MAEQIQTYKDFQRWLKPLFEEQLAAPILAPVGADDYGQTEYVFVTDLVDVARERVQVSGGSEGPVLLVQELVGPPQGENG
jgi:hypothetical protein